MAKCRKCGKEISRLDNDVCPFCGCEKPIEADYKTMDITRTLESVEQSDLYKAKSKKKAFLYCLFLGMFGVPDFYLGFQKRGYFFIFLTIFLIGALGSALFFACGQNGVMYVVALLGPFVFHVLRALILKANPDARDASGEFLR